MVGFFVQVVFENRDDGEMAFSKVKAHLRNAKAITCDELWKAIGAVTHLFSPDKCRNDFRAYECVAD